MSARKLGNVGSLQQPVTITGRQAHLELSAESVSIHKSGIEFRSPTPFTEWTEMTVTLHSPRDDSKLQCNGVVIACSGNKHSDYRVSLVFTGISKQAQTLLNSMVYSQIGLG